MNFWVFAASLTLFLVAGATGGRFLGDYIDKNYRREKSLLKQEMRYSKAVLKWMQKTHRKKALVLKPEIEKKLASNIEKYFKLLDEDQPDRSKLLNERRRSEQFIEEHLSNFKKSSTREYVESIGIAVLIALALRAFVIEAFQIPSGSMIPSLRVGDHIFVNKLSYGIRFPYLPLKIFGTRIPPLSWNWTLPERGDVIVFIKPHEEEEDYIKRVVGLPGDVIEVTEHHVLVNNKPCPIDNGKLFKYRDLDEHGQPTGSEAVTKRYQEKLGDKNHEILRRSCKRDVVCGFGQGCDISAGVCRQSSYGPFTVPEDHLFVMGDNRDNSLDSRSWGTVPMELVKGRAVFIWWSYRENLVQWDRMFMGIN
jgi:signal peptidase I